MSNKSLDGVLTKKAHTREKFSEEQIQDLVECSNSKTGFEYFAKKFFFIQHPVEGKMLFQPYEYQRNLLHSYHDHRFNVNMLPRQSGKTTTAACYPVSYTHLRAHET